MARRYVSDRLAHVHIALGDEVAVRAAAAARSLARQQIDGNRDEAVLGDREGAVDELREPRRTIVISESMARRWCVDGSSMRRLP